MQIEVWESYFVRQKTALQQPTTPGQTAFAMLLHFESMITVFDTWAAVPGIVAYIKNQAGDQAFDVIANIQSIRAAMAAGRDALIALIPDRTPAVISATTFTAAQMAPVVAEIDAITSVLG